jgi:hypothetical protein
MAGTKQLLIELPTEIADQLEQKAAEAKLPPEGADASPIRTKRVSAMNWTLKTPRCGSSRSGTLFD